MKYALLYALMAFATFPLTCLAQYQIDVAVEAGGSSDNFTLFPRITVRENLAATDAFVTFESPGINNFSGFVNNPSETSSSSAVLDSTQEILDEVNQTWSVTIEDNGNSFAYDVDVELILPFAELPHFESSTLVNNGPVGTFSWSLDGGSLSFPGSSSLVRASLETLAFEDIDEIDLPITATTWTPTGDLGDTDLFRARIQTRLEAIDPSSFRVTDIRALANGSPSLTFGSTTIQYTASRAAILVAVPEPSSSLIVGTMTLIGMGLGRRRHCSS